MSDPPAIWPPRLKVGPARVAHPACAPSRLEARQVTEREEAGQLSRHATQSAADGSRADPDPSDNNTSIIIGCHARHATRDSSPRGAPSLDHSARHASSPPCPNRALPREAACRSTLSASSSSSKSFRRRSLPSRASPACSTSPSTNSPRTRYAPASEYAQVDRAAAGGPAKACVAAARARESA